MVEAEPIVPVTSLFPYPNLSSFLFNSFHWLNGSQWTLSSREKLQKLVTGPDFQPKDIEGTNFKAVDRLIDEQLNGSYNLSGIEVPTGGWTSTPLTIDVPTKNGPSTPFEIPGFLHRSITDIIRNAFSSLLTVGPFHYVPFREYWIPPGQTTEERLHGEVYASEAFNTAHEEIQNLPRREGDTRERVVAAVMLWSDATHLSQFGHSKLWPVYMYLGNQSKYVRCSPCCRAAHHLAYLPSVRPVQWYSRFRVILANY